MIKRMTRILGLGLALTGAIGCLDGSDDPESSDVETSGSNREPADTLATDSVTDGDETSALEETITSGKSSDADNASGCRFDYGPSAIIIDTFLNDPVRHVFYFSYDGGKRLERVEQTAYGPSDSSQILYRNVWTYRYSPSGLIVVIEGASTSYFTDEPQEDRSIIELSYNGQDRLMDAKMMTLEPANQTGRTVSRLSYTYDDANGLAQIEETDCSGLTCFAHFKDVRLSWDNDHVLRKSYFRRGEAHDLYTFGEANELLSSSQFNDQSLTTTQWQWILDSDPKVLSVHREETWFSSPLGLSAVSEFEYDAENRLSALRVVETQSWTGVERVTATSTITMTDEGSSCAFEALGVLELDLPFPPNSGLLDVYGRGDVLAGFRPDAT